MTTLTPDVCIVGAGSAGLVVAAGAAQLGLDVVMIERAEMGGDCLNYGCVPSKAIIRSARLCAELRRAGNLGVKVPAGVEVDFAGVMARMRRLRTQISGHDSARRFSSRKMYADTSGGVTSRPPTAKRTTPSRPSAKR